MGAIMKTLEEHIATVTAMDGFFTNRRTPELRKARTKAVLFLRRTVIWMKRSRHSPAMYRIGDWTVVPKNWVRLPWSVIAKYLKTSPSTVKLLARGALSAICFCKEKGESVTVTILHENTGTEWMLPLKLCAAHREILKSTLGMFVPGNDFHAKAKRTNR